jgi:small subunit ribosomal protein S3
VIGKDGEKLEKFEKALKKAVGRAFKVTVKDVKVPELSAKIMAEFAAIQLENRMPYRRVAKSVLQKVMEKGAIGVKIQVGGRLGGVDLSRSEKFSDGRIPLQTIRADVDYHYTTALTKYGILGIKVWVCKGENIQVSKQKAALDRVVKNA